MTGFGCQPLREERRIAIVASGAVRQRGRSRGGAAMRLALARLGALVAAAGCVAGLTLLVRYRPPWPDLPDSLSAPVTTTQLQQLVLVAAWLLGSLVAVVLLIESVRAMRRTRRFEPPSLAPAVTDPYTRRLSPDGLTLQPLGVQPRLVVVARSEESKAHGPTTSPARPNGATPSVEEPEHRPLISLLGPLAIYGAKRSRRGLRARALELIAFLALRREGAQRDEILEALWPGEDPKRSRHRLYQAVRDARRLLGDAVVSERDRYWLDRSQIRVDIDEFRCELHHAERAQGGAREAFLECALELVRGDPLAGSDYTWADGEIRRLRGLITDRLEQLGYVRLYRGDAAGALLAAERAIELDALNEPSAYGRLSPSATKNSPGCSTRGSGSNRTARRGPPISSFSGKTDRASPQRPASQTPARVEPATRHGSCWTRPNPTVRFETASLERRAYFLVPAGQERTEPE